MWLNHLFKNINIFISLKSKILQHINLHFITYPVGRIFCALFFSLCCPSLPMTTSELNCVVVVTPELDGVVVVATELDGVVVVAGAHGCHTSFIVISSLDQVGLGHGRGHKQTQHRQQFHHHHHQLKVCFSLTPM